jgi:hypothetical protein
MEKIFDVFFPPSHPEKIFDVFLPPSHPMEKIFDVFFPPSHPMAANLTVESKWTDRRN